MIPRRKYLFLKKKKKKTSLLDKHPRRSWQKGKRNLEETNVKFILLPNSLDCQGPTGWLRRKTFVRKFYAKADLLCGVSSLFGSQSFRERVRATKYRKGERQESSSLFQPRGFPVSLCPPSSSNLHPTPTPLPGCGPHADPLPATGSGCSGK